MHSNGWSNNDCKGSDSCMFGRGVWQSLSLQRFPFYFYSAAEAYSRMCCLFCASLSPFVRCEEAGGGGESVSAVGNNDSLSLQWVNGKKPAVHATSV